MKAIKMPANAAIHIGANRSYISASLPAIVGISAEPKISPTAVGMATAVAAILGGTDSAGSVDRYMGYIPAPKKP